MQSVQHTSKFTQLMAVLILIHSLAGCALTSEPRVVVITATFDPARAAISNPTSVMTSDITPMVGGTEIAEVVPLEQPASTQPRQHIVQTGETLYGIAETYNTTIETLIELNQLTNPDVISVGQVLELPPLPNQQTPDFKLLADAQLVRGHNSLSFDVAAFIAQQPGYIRAATDKVTTNRADGLGVDEILTSAEIVQRVSLEFSVDPRVLLAMLEYRAGWLSSITLPENLQTFPMISEEDSGTIDRKGLYKQLAWTANELNRGYYGRKYNGWSIIEFEDGTRFLYASSLNPASVGVQHFLHLNNTPARWLRDISADGFFRIYNTYFGSPLADQSNTLAGISAQPSLTLPFKSGETWFFTGGAHGGWGTGSAWAAVDFAPPDDLSTILCYISEYPAVAVASGTIARSDKGAVMLDLDGDGDETTGWNILYLHLATNNRITTGTMVKTGDTIGYAACEGGFSTATHLHIARRYNGEWLPAMCFDCPSDTMISSFTMSGWAVVALRDQEYQGYLERGGERRTAEQGRSTPINRISW